MEFPMGPGFSSTSPLSSNVNIAKHNVCLSVLWHFKPGFWLCFFMIHHRVGAAFVGSEQ